ncbi:MAG: adenine phosphoribosyltransferase [Propionibacteriaceae bacterium]|jgi:adenine phosphoribosyltransferase|nr:adenine phosphoribosyltransferase [Propionibacteriaceae bacterium]
MGTDPRVDLVASFIKDVPDFPHPGVTFKDITPLLANPPAYAACVDALVDHAPDKVDVVVGMEARGFLFAAPVALKLGVGFVPVRKPGKLPGDVYSETFDLEYGQDTLTVHQDAIRPGARVLVVDDILATGGTIGATARLIQHLGADLVHVEVVLELGFLHGKQHLAEVGINHVSALVTV